MDPKLNNGETRSFWMLRTSAGENAACARTRTRRDCLPGRTGEKRAHPFVSPETNRVHYLSYYPLSSYLNYCQKYVLLHFHGDDA